MTRALLSLVALLAATSVPGKTVEMKVVTSNGYVAYTVAGDWRVIASESRAPISVMAFQILNPADEGSPDSTNVAVRVFQLDSDKGRAALAGVPLRVGDAEPRREQVGEWEIFRQEGRQESTSYSIVDAKRSFAQAGIAIRVAWPHLARNPADYDAQMEATLRQLIGSVREHVGAWEPSEGEVIRRPAE